MGYRALNALAQNLRYLGPSLELLDFLAQHPGCRSEDMQAQLGVSRATLHRLLAQLRALGLEIWYTVPDGYQVASGEVCQARRLLRLLSQPAPFAGRLPATMRPWRPTKTGGSQ